MMDLSGHWTCTAYEPQPGPYGGIAACSASFRDSERGWQRHDAMQGWVRSDEATDRAAHLLVRVSDLPRHPQ